MRTLLVVAVLGAACMLAANTASATDQGQVPASMLAQMGLSTMQPMSDVQGMTVRGMGRRGGTIQVNAVVQIGSAGSANGGSGGSFNGGSGGSGLTYITPVGGGNGGAGGSAGSVYFNNDVATFIQVNVSRGSLLGRGIN